MRRLSIFAVLAAAGLSTGALAQPTSDPLGGSTDTAGTEATTTDTVDATDTPADPGADATPAATDPLGGAMGTGTTTPKTPEKEPEADTPPQPKDRTGSFGVGVEGPLGFRLAPSPFVDTANTFRLPALSLVYPASALFHFQILAGAVLAVGSGSPAAVQLGVTLRGIYLGLILSEVVHLTIPFGLGYTLSIVPDFAGSITSHYFHLEAGIRPEWFITNYFSIHTQAGVVMSLLTGTTASSGGAVYDPGVGLNLFANTDLMAQAGFTVWFK